MAFPIIDPVSAPLSRTTATSLSIFLTILYLAIQYIHPHSRPRRACPRNAPYVIRARSAAALATSAISVVLVLVVVVYSGVSFSTALHALGLRALSLPRTLVLFRALIPPVILFTAPLAARISADDWAGWRGEYQEAVRTWEGYRNHISAPFTEEVVFRSCIVALHLVAGLSGKELVFLTPLYFGLAHLHRLYEFWLDTPDRMVLGVMQSFVQFCYTTIFGWFGAFVLCRTGNVWCCVAVHSFCNWMGLPMMRVKGVGSVGQWGYRAAMVVGMWGFYRTMWWGTESRDALVRF